MTKTTEKKLREKIDKLVGTKEDFEQLVTGQIRWKPGAIERHRQKIIKMFTTAIKEAVEEERERIITEVKKEIDLVCEMEGSSFGMYEALNKLNEKE